MLAVSTVHTYRWMEELEIRENADLNGPQTGRLKNRVLELDA